MKRKSTTVVLLLALFAGLSLLLYPTVSDYWNSFHQSRAIAGYTSTVAGIDTADYEQMWSEAEVYNQKLLADTGNRYLMTEEEELEYESLLDVTGTGIIGYVEIPKLNTSLPIYHGTDDAVLQIAIGHLAGSSLPVGGEGTHCVLTGHRGLPSAKLFTNLDQMEEGDLFFLHVLDQTLTYETDQIRIVEPQDMEELDIEEGTDYCTLVTCTPYGVNSHRLLVRGHRVGNPEEERLVPADAVQIDRLLAAPAVAGMILLALGMGSLLCKVYHAGKRKAVRERTQGITGTRWKGQERKGKKRKARKEKTDGRKDQ